MYVQQFFRVRTIKVLTYNKKSERYRGNGAEGCPLEGKILDVAGMSITSCEADAKCDTGRGG